MTLADSTRTRTEDDPRWPQVVARDAAADGSFVYAVRTTGVYCRPSCPSRQAKPQNVTFHASPAAAEAAGHRACRRCRPDIPAADAAEAAMAARACRLIEEAEEPPKLAALAAAAGLSPHHFHRRFKAVTGLTPRAYAAAHRAKRVRQGLAAPDTSITAAIYGAGFNAGSRFYAQADRVLGMTPTAFRRGGAGADIRFAVGQCRLGAILVAQSRKGLCAIALGDDADALVRDLQDEFPNANLLGGDADFERVMAQVIGFVEAPALGLDLPLDLRATAFQQRVWLALSQIPVGETASYTDIAQRIGAPQAVRAVAQACGANRIAVAIPCHRVVRHDGALSGYRWGVARKRALLDAEAGR